jgi:hypothetical protein
MDIRAINKLEFLEALKQDRAQEESVLGLIGSRVAYADYEAIRADFSHIHSSALTEAEIDNWILKNASYISQSQAKDNGVNGRIRLNGETKKAFRPIGYGRSFIVQADDPKHDFPQGKKPVALFDLKGVGVAQNNVPIPGKHSDGLEYLGHVISDFIIQKLISKILSYTVPRCLTVNTYAILDLGFDIVDGWKGTQPAGCHVRQAHLRPHGSVELPRFGGAVEKVKFEIEMILRNYGITSATRGSSLEIFTGRDGSQTELFFNEKKVQSTTFYERQLLNWIGRGREKIRIDGINVQIARHAHVDPLSALLYDFGHYNIRRKFMFPVSSLVRDRPLRLGLILYPEDKEFIQPIKEIALNPELYERQKLNEACFDAASAFRKNGDRTAVELLLTRYLKEYIPNWDFDY